MCTDFVVGESAGPAADERSRRGRLALGSSHDAVAAVAAGSESVLLLPGGGDRSMVMVELDGSSSTIDDDCSTSSITDARSHLIRY